MAAKKKSTAKKKYGKKAGESVEREIRRPSAKARRGSPLTLAGAQ